jgi:hypothetical protein
VNEEFLKDIIRQAPSHNIFLEVLQEVFATGQAVEVLCTGIRESTQICGFVERIYEDTVVIRKVDDEGDDDGISILRINKIRRIQQNTRKICRAMFFREQNVCGAFNERNIYADTTVDGIYAEMEIALATGEPIECALDHRCNHSYISGLVQRLNGDFCQILEICYDGDPDGIVTFRWRDVHSIERDTPDLQQMMALYNARQYVYDKADLNS